jgi:hypothetical protein
MKIKSIIALVIALLVLLVVAGAAYGIASFMKSHTQQSADDSQNGDMHQAKTCNFPQNSARNSLFITIGSLNGIDQAKSTIQSLFNDAKGNITSLNDSTYDGIRNVDISGTIPQDKFSGFASEVRNLGKSPNAIENENFSTQSYDQIMTECKGLTSQLNLTYQQKDYYETQLASSKSSIERQDLSRRISDLEQQIFGMEQAYTQMSQDLNASMVNIAITNNGIGG